MTTIEKPARVYKAKIYPKDRLARFADRVAFKWCEGQLARAKQGEKPILLSGLLKDLEWLESFIYGFEHDETRGGYRLAKPCLKNLRRSIRSRAVEILQRDQERYFELIWRLRLLADRRNSPREVAARKEKERQEAQDRRWRLNSIKNAQNVLRDRMTRGILEEMKACESYLEADKILHRVCKEFARRSKAQA